MHFDKNCFRPVQGETEALWIERQQFSIWFRVQHDEGETIFFVDETGFKIEMRTQYGRSKRGINAEGQIPNIRSRNISVVAAMSSTGLPPLQDYHIMKFLMVEEMQIDLAILLTI